MCHWCCFAREGGGASKYVPVLMTLTVVAVAITCLVQRLLTLFVASRNVALHPDKAVSALEVRHKQTDHAENQCIQRCLEAIPP